MRRPPVAMLIGLLLAGCSPRRHAAPSATSLAPQAAPRMTSDRLDVLVHRLDAGAARSSNTWTFAVGERHLILIADERADRMRVMAPVAEASALPTDVQWRMLQANFDTALDARYAIARGQVWSAFIHPLGALTDDELLSGIAQVVGLATTYGSTYSSGGLVFQGGDTSKMYEEQRRELERKRKAGQEL